MLPDARRSRPFGVAEVLLVAFGSALSTTVSIDTSSYIRSTNHDSIAAISPY